MKTRFFSKATSILLALIIVMGLLPSFSAQAAIINVDKDTRDKYGYGVKAVQALSAVADKPVIGTVAGGVFGALFKSDTDYILEAIAELSNKIDALSQQIKDLSNAFVAKNNEVPIKTALIVQLGLFTAKASQLKATNMTYTGIVSDIDELTNPVQKAAEMDKLLFTTIPKKLVNGTDIYTAVEELGIIITDKDITTGLDLLGAFDKFSAYANKWEHLGYKARFDFHTTVSTLYANLSALAKMSLSARYQAELDKGELGLDLKNEMKTLDTISTAVNNAFVANEIIVLPNSLRNYNYPGHEMLISAVAVPRSIYNGTNYNGNQKKYSDFERGVLYYDFTGKYATTDRYEYEIEGGSGEWYDAIDYKYPEAIHSFPDASWFKAVSGDYAGPTLESIFFNQDKGSINRDLYDNFKVNNSAGTNADKDADVNMTFVTGFGGLDRIYRHYTKTGTWRVKVTGVVAGYHYFTWDEYWIDVVNNYGILANEKGKEQSTRLADVDNENVNYWLVNEPAGINANNRWLYTHKNTGDSYTIPTIINNWVHRNVMMGIVKMDRMKVKIDGNLSGTSIKLSVLDKSNLMPGSYSYQWQERAINSGFDSDFYLKKDEHGNVLGRRGDASGENTRTLTISNPADKAGYQYRCIISKLDANGKVIETEIETSLSTTLGGGMQNDWDYNPPVYGMDESYGDPYSNDIELSLDAIYNATRSNTYTEAEYDPGTGEITYTEKAGVFPAYTFQWEQGSYAGGFVPIDGAVGSIYALGAVDYSMNGNQYRCKIRHINTESGKTETLTSQAVTLNLETYGNWSDYAANWLAVSGEISTADELAYLAKQVNNGEAGYIDGDFILTDDIELGEHDWTPIGDASTLFSGTFNGDGHTISGMTIENGAYNAVLGLFGYVDGGTIKSLTLEGVSITSTADSVGIGGVAGIIGDSIVENCGVWGAIESDGDGANVGGLVGYSNGSEITDCKTGIEVTSTGDNTFTGGLVGANEDSEITDSFAVGSVVSNGGYINMGGLVGYSTNSKIDGCFALGSVTGTNDGATAGEVVVGGLVGTNLNDATISECYTAVEVCGMNEYNDESTGSVYVGGLVGLNDSNSGTPYDKPYNHVTDCYTAMSTEGYSEHGVAYVGGLIGVSNDGEVARCYVSGAVRGSGYVSPWYINGVIGAVGVIYEANDLYWNSETTGQVYLWGVLGKDESENYTYFNLPTQAMTDDNVLTTGAMSDRFTYDPYQGSYRGMGSAWTKQENDDTSRYYPELKVFAESDDFTKRMFSSMSAMVFNPRIKFDAQGGEVDPPYAQTGPNYTLSELPTPTRSGYIFNGWYASLIGGEYLQEVTTETLFFSDWTVYAKWTIDTRNMVYVALGDSVPAGYGLSNSSTESYPAVLSNLLALGNIPNNPVNLSVKGMTSGDLWAKLQDLSASDPAAYSAIQNAGLITLNIGGNNVLGPMIELMNQIAAANGIDINDPTQLSQLITLIQQMDLSQNAEIAAGVQAFSTEFPQIILWLKTNAPGTKIIVSTIYNPFPQSMGTIYAAAAQMIGVLNGVIVQAQTTGGYAIADTYSAFAAADIPVTNFNPMAGSIDIHPNANGHALMAQIHLAAALPTITFDANGGSVSTAAVQTGADGKLAELPTPTRSGRYRFDGWYTTASGGTKITTSTIFAEDTTVYAHWTYTGGDYTPPSDPTPTPQKTVDVMINGQTVKATLDEEGALTLTYTESDILKYINNTGDFVITVSGQNSVIIIIPITVLGNDNLVINTDFGAIIIPNATLQAIRTLYGDTLRLMITKGSFRAALLDDKNKEVAYNDPAHPFILTLPYTLKSGQKPGAVVAVGKDGKVLPFAVYKDGSVTFEITATGTYNVIYNKKEFSDASDHWALDYIDFVAARSLYAGDGKGSFMPKGSMTRAMFVQVLANLEGVDLSVYKTSRFNDVQADIWYAAAVEWAADKGIVSGDGNGKFAPDTEITREQMVVMLYNYMKYKGYSVASGTALSFTDKSQISSWALDAVKAIQNMGIVTGKPGNLFDPKATATRAEVATIFARFVEYVASMSAK